MRARPVLQPIALAGAMSCGVPSSPESDTGMADESSTSGASEASGEGETAGDGDGDLCPADVPITEEVLGPGLDPEDGDFTLAEALADLPEGPGPLRAELITSLGTFTCTLEPDQAPIGVANFVGLARGRRPWRHPQTNEWVRHPYYDGTIFHRVIPGFMIQGGDVLGTGLGSPGYTFEDEFSELRHAPGTLSSANGGPNTNGAQFFITEVSTPWLDDVHTILGTCDPVSGVTAIASVPRDGNDRPLEDVVLERVIITRCATD